MEWNMKMLTKILVGSGVVAATMGVAGLSLAEGMQVEPGKWEFTTRVVAPMMPTPITTVETECVTRSEIRPQMFLRDIGGCTLEQSEADAVSMRWKMTCMNPSGRVDGEGSAHSTGTTVRGAMSLLMHANGQQMSMTHNWEGKRVGPCD